MNMKVRMINEQSKDEEGGEPVSPSTRAFSTSVLSLSIQVVLELQRPVLNIYETMKTTVDVIISKNPRFGSILENDDKGITRWRKTSVNLEDHLFTPRFPPGCESYDVLVSEYISSICQRPFDRSRPLWEFHLMNCPTSRAESTLLIRIHHALGDGISLMSALYASFTRADNPSHPLTFPIPKKPNTDATPRGFTPSHDWSRRNWVERVWYLILVMRYTVADVTNCFLRMMGWLEDSQIPIRGPPGVELLPVAISSVELPLEDIKRIKASIGGTVNDVLTGIIFCGIQRYLQICLSAAAGQEQKLQGQGEKGLNSNDIVTKQMKKVRVTTLSMINKRTLAGIEYLENMLKPNAQIPWGNHFGFLHLQIPLGITENPIEFVRSARNILKKQKMSLGVNVITNIIGLLERFGLQEAFTKYAYKTIISTTLAISNMIGPIEKIAINKNVIERCSFFVSGAPQALSIHILSYMDTITMQVIAQKAYINSNMLSNIFKETFEEIKEAYLHNMLNTNQGSS